MASYNKVVTDEGKGRQMLRRSRGSIILAAGTVFDVIDQIPVPFKIRRVLIGTAVATNITSVDVLVLPKSSDIDTAVDVSNQVITTIDNLTTAKLLDSDDIVAGAAGALTTVGKRTQAAESLLVLNVVHGAAVVGGDVFAIVEWDAVGPSYGAYDAGEDAAGAYES